MRFFDKHLYFKKKKLPRSIAAILVLITFYAILSGFCFMVLPPLMEQISAISSISDADFNKSFGEPIADIRNEMIKLGISMDDFNMEYVKTQLKDWLNFDRVGEIASNILSFASSFVGWVFIVTFITFFLLKEKYLFYRILHTLTPSKYEGKMQAITRNLNYMLGRYFRSILLQVIVFGTYIFIGLEICGEKYALTVAIFSGLINLISYIGPLMGVSFALLFSIFSHIGGGFYDVILPQMYEVILVYLIAIALDNFISYPLIFSNSLKVHPLELFFVILAGAQLGGLGGMMVAAPLYTVLRIIAKESLSQFEIIKSLTKKI